MDERQNKIDNPGKMQGVVNENKGKVFQYFGDSSPKPPDHIFNVPYPRNSLFTGHDDLLAHLHNYLIQQPRAAITQPSAINGLGGIGKTQAAVEYAYRHKDDYPYVLWVNASSDITFNEGFVKIARLLHLPEKDEADQSVVVEAVKNWLAQDDRWLLIFDNAEELSLAARYFPPEPHGHLLLTTRARATHPLAHSFTIEKMKTEEGVLFLLQRATLLNHPASLSQIDETNYAHAASIVQEMDGLPLALDQAGAYIAETSCLLADYLTVYCYRKADLLTRRGSTSQYPASVATTWMMAFDKIEKSNPIAAELLNVLAFLAPNAIAEEILIAGASELGPQLQRLAKDPTLLNDACATLSHFSLVQRDPINHLLSIHRLVQAVLQLNMDEQTKRTWEECTIRAVNKAFPTVEVVSWSQCERVLPHALACTKLIEIDMLTFLETASLLNRTGGYLFERAQYTDAEPLLQRALAIREQVLGPHHPDTATSLNNLAYLYRNQGKYAQAKPLLQRALAIREQVLGSHHPDTALSLNNLARLYYRQGKYAQAEPLLQRALAIREQVLGSHHPDTARNLNNLARIYYRHGKYAQAKPLYQRALAIREQVLEPDHPDIATSLNNLGALYHRQGKYMEAEPLLQRALAIRELVLGPHHPDTATSLNDLAGLYHSQGKYTEAEPLLQRAFTIRELVHGSHHPDTARSLNYLAYLYLSQGKYTEAEPLLQSALTTKEKVLGLHHPSTASSLNNLATLYESQEKHAEAEPLFQRAFAIRELVLGPDHPDTAHSLNDLAGLYYRQENAAEAEPLFQRSLAIRERVLGEEHLDTARSLNDLAELYESQDKDAEAEPLYQRALVIYEQVLGREHPNTRTIRANYVALQKKLHQKH